MAFLDDLTLGRYVPSDSVLHRLDPRVKFVLLPSLVIASFVAVSPQRLGGLAVLALLLIGASGLNPRLWLRGIRALRWLLLFTLVMHLLLLPGRTLWGIPWLSYDGLLSGATVCSQLILAVLFSSLLTLTTSPQRLAAACGWFLMPLARFRFPAEETTALLLLVLHFLPVLREEVSQASSEFSAEKGGRWLARLRQRLRLVAALVMSLADRADAMAIALARGDEEAFVLTRPTPFPPLGIAGGSALIGGGLSLALLFGWLR